MGKKKPFIDKKNASTYHVVRRSQRDVGGLALAGHVGGGPDGEEETHEGGVPSDFVLMASPDNRRTDHDEAILGRGGGGGHSSHPSGSGGGGGGKAMSMSKLQERVARAGLLDDDYDYDKHTKPITGSGVYYSRDAGRVVSPGGDAATLDPRSAPLRESDDGDLGVNEVDRQLESIALTPDCMDDDVAQALFGSFDEGEFEEILDDFCVTAAQEPEPEVEAEAGAGAGEEGEETEFDYDAHIRGLIERAEKQAGRGGDFDPGAVPDDHEWAREGGGAGDFFRNARPLHMRDVEEDEDDEEDDDGANSLDREFDFEEDDGGGALDAPPGVVPALGPDEERALRDKFEATLAQYDSDEVGDLDDECEDIRGELPLEGDRRVEAAFDEFLLERKDEIFIEGTNRGRTDASSERKKRVGGSSYSALVGRRMVQASELSVASAASGGDVPPRGGEEDDEGPPPPPVREVLAEADAILAHPEMEPPPEDILIDGKSYFSEARRNPFDCESILTTYSNLDNNPAVIVRSGRRGRGKKKKGKAGSNSWTDHSDRLQEEEVPAPPQIVLSNKTGLPLGVLSAKEGQQQQEEEGRRWDDGDEGTYVSVNKGEARRRDERPTDKKVRKAAVREERRVARMQKKMMREAFAEEFVRRAGDAATATGDVAGKSVFRYS